MLGLFHYLRGTRHPWPSFCFLLPLLLAYEGGVLWLGGEQSDSLRNGADSWMRWVLESAGMYQLGWPPLLVGLFFLIWSVWRFGDRPDGMVSLFTGMTIESAVLALALWWLGFSLVPLMNHYGVELAVPTAPNQALGHIISFVGAGIYEEVLFRLLLFTALVWFLRWVWFPTPLAVVVAAVGSGAFFSYAHHMGPHGEPFDNYVFLFRLIAGVYFAMVYRLRGFGVAVGTHALYDVLVGVAIG